MLGKTIKEWEEIYEIRIMDTRGFGIIKDGIYEKVYTKEEFKKGKYNSFVQTSHDDNKNPVIMIFKVHTSDNNWCAFDKLEQAFVMFKAELDNECDDVEIEVTYMRKNTFDELPEFQY